MVYSARRIADQQNYIKGWMNLFFTYESIVVYVIQNISANLQLPAFHLMRMLPCKRIRRTKLALGCAAKKIVNVYR